MKLFWQLLIIWVIKFNFNLLVMGGVLSAPLVELLGVFCYFSLLRFIASEFVWLVKEILLMRKFLICVSLISYYVWKGASRTVGKDETHLQLTP